MVIANRRIAFILAVLILVLASGCLNTPPNLVNTPDDVSGKVIGALKGTPSERMAGELGQPEVFTSGDEMMALLLAGMIDCAIMENSAAIELVAQSPEARILSDSLIEYDLRFAVAKENAELLAAVNSALDALRQNGTLSGLVGKYFANKKYTYVSPEGGGAHSGYLSIAVPPDSPPFSYKNANGGYLGLDIEVALAVCDYLGVGIQVIEYDSWELVNAVWFGLADMALGWRPGEGEDLVNISDSYANAVHVVIVRR